MDDKCKVISMNVAVTNINDAVFRVVALANEKNGAYVCVSNVHMCMKAYDSTEFASIVNNADLIIPDGMPLSWAQKLLGHKNAEQVRGQDIMGALCQLSGKQSLNIGFYGGSSEELLERLQIKLRSSYPDIKITYAYSPPFRPLTAEEDSVVVSDISLANIDVLFVGIGCPKQERWMAEHKSKVKCVMLGVGAAFDFIAGEKKQAPLWLQRAGMEWFFRLCFEPNRLWKRYLFTNPRFIWHFSKQYVKQRISYRSLEPD